MNENTVKAWFDIVESMFEEFDITPETMYAADEVGSNTHADERVIGVRKSGPQYQQRGGNRENWTVMVTIRGDSKATRPLVIYKGKVWQAEWYQHNPANALCMNQTLFNCMTSS